jgi:hypothetical protein
MELQLLFIGLTLAQFALLFAVFVALYDVARSGLRLETLSAFCAAIVLLGIAGYLAYWLAFSSYLAFRIVKIAALVLLVGYFGIVVRRGRLAAHLAEIREPIAFAGLFTVMMLTLGFAAGGIDDPARIAQIRFGHTLPPDNIIPMIVADMLRDGVIHSPTMGDWLTSDRPPLQAGLYLLLSLQLRPLGYEIVAAWLQATFLFGVWGLCVAAALPVAARRLTLLACCLLPPMILNTFYTWPKLLSACYLLLCFALLFRRPAPDRSSAATGVLIGCLAALALLSHGTAAFALIGFAIAVVAFWAWPPFKTMLAGAAALLAVYVPWMLYQTFIDPPGNRLMKWHLAGAVDVDPRPFGQTLREAYGALTWQDYLSNKMENVGVIVGTWPRSLAEIARLIVGRDGDIAPAVRIADFFQFLPSLHVFSLALIVALVLLAFMPAGEREQRDFALRLLVALVATLVVFVLLIFMPGHSVNHQGSYATHAMATVLAFMVLALRVRWLALAFIAVQVVTVTAAYVVTLPQGAGGWLLLGLFIAATLALFAYALAPVFATSRPTR